MSDYCLSKLVPAHEDCIRELLIYHDDIHGQFPHIVTISRDCTAKVFRIVNGIIENNVEFAFYLPSPISSGAIIVVDNQTGLVNYAFGCMDGKIYVYPTHDSSPKILSGHSQNVCVLKTNTTLPTTRLATGSWDKTTCIYDEKFNVMAHITAHTESVNDVLFVSGDRLLTASSDKSIMLWDISHNGFASHIVAFNGHEDCVRSLLQLENLPGIFFSSSNDQTVRSWDLNTHLPLNIYAGHSHFIFKIAQLDTMNHFISAGEDKTICIWHKDKLQAPEQTIKTPIGTIWSIVAIDNNTFAVAASDGRLYLFSNRSELKASLEEQDLFNGMFAADQVIPYDTVRHLRVYEEDSLVRIMGTKDGEQRLVRSIVNNNINVYQWSSSSEKWSPIGHLSDYEAQEDVDQQGRVWFNGEYYDQVLNVRLNKRAYKLALNRDQNSWEVAKQFIDSYGIDGELLEQIVRSIVFYADYKPKKVNTYGYFPIYDFVFFEQALDVNKFGAKFKEFNDQQTDPQLKLDENALGILLNNFCSLIAHCPNFVQAFKVLLNWQSNKFIVYDLLRITLMDKFFNSYFLHYFPHESLLSCLKVSANDMPTQLTLFRVMANLFNTIDGCQFMYEHHQLITEGVLKWKQLVANQNVQIAYSAIWFNYSVLLVDVKKREDYDFAEKIMLKVVESAKLENLAERAIANMLLTFGNILAAKHRSEMTSAFLETVETYPQKYPHMAEVNNIVQHLNRFAAYNP